MSIDYAARARALVRTRFRLQGRGEGGLDCVGVVLATFGIDAAIVRRDYRLRDVERVEIDAALRKHFRRVPVGQLRVGDLILLDAGKRQLHLAIQTDGGFIHAHAGIGRVVETPGSPEWPVLGTYRKRVRKD